MIRLIVSIICIIGTITSSYGIDTLFINQAFEHEKIQEFGYVLQSVNTDANIDSILKLSSDDFLAIKETGITFRPLNQVYWVTYILENRTDTILDLIFEIKNPAINYVQFFQKSGENLKKSELTGAYQNFDSRAIKHRNFLYPIQIPSNSTIQIYTFLNQQGESINIDGHLWETKYFYNQDKNTTFFWTIYLGTICCFSLLSIIVSLIVRTQLLLSFTIYCSASFVLALYLTGFGFKYFWSSFPAINYTIGYSSLIIIMLALLGMARNFLNTQKYLSTIDKTILFHQVYILSFIPAIILNHDLPPTLLNITYYLGQIGQVSFVLTIIIASILTFRKTNTKDSIAFLFSFLFMLASIIVYLTRASGIQNSNFFSNYGIYLGWLIDILMFTIIIGFRIRSNFLKSIRLEHQLTQTQLRAANALLEERQRLSRELHDGISIKMALFKMQLAQFFSKKSIENQDFITQVSDISEDIRAFTHAIAPLNLEEQTLEEALEDLIYKIENQTNIEISIETDKFKEAALSKSEKHAIFQTTQELLNNTMKYAQATSVHILIQNEESFSLEYADNGKGFDTATNYEGIGLKNIKARAQLLNGKFEVFSDEKGSRFEFSF